jgi:hypothetical protein
VSAARLAHGVCSVSWNGPPVVPVASAIVLV